jgi:triosephosphate isomerase (TIM)
VNTFPEEVLAKAKYDPKKVEVVVAPTDLHLTTAQSKLSKTNVHVAAQDVSQYGRGAYTGNITADQLTDAKIEWTLTGHSERRSLFGESDQDVALKTKVALENGLNVMLCIGESLEERESGKTGKVNARQLQAVVDEITEGQWGKVVVAYEPVWAIGTGKVATPEQAQETHAEIRDWLAANVSSKVAGATRILYGGSVNGANCADLISNQDIDGFLVGGASLKPEFKDIIEAADKDKK